jgi:hypothetical protein
MRAQAMKNLEHYKWWPGNKFLYSGTLYNPPIVGDVKGLLGAINLGNASGGTNWPAAAPIRKRVSSTRRRTCPRLRLNPWRHRPRVSPTSRIRRASSAQRSAYVKRLAPAPMRMFRADQLRRPVLQRQQPPAAGGGEQALQSFSTVEGCRL